VCLNLKIYELTQEWKNRVTFLYCTHNIVRVIKRENEMVGMWENKYKLFIFKLEVYRLLKSLV
jgi:hypothetical protein